MVLAEKDYLGTTKAAHFLEVSSDKIRRLVRSGQLTGENVMGRWAIPLTELARYRSEHPQAEEVAR